MSNDVSVIALFCDDIREETKGTDTIIGILPDNLRVPKLPGALPKLCVYVRTHIKADVDVGAFTTRIVMPGGQEVRRSDATSEIVESGRKRANAKGAPFVGFITKFVFAPLPISEPGRILVMVAIGGVEYVAGALNVEAVPQGST